jgi:hypothetical protein
MKDHKLVPLRPPESILAVVRKAYGNATAYDVGHVWHEIYTRLPDAAPVQEPTYRTDQQIVDQTEELAKFLLSWKYGHVPETDKPMRDAIHPKAEDSWQAACRVQEILTDTDPMNAVAEVDDAPIQEPAPVQEPVHKLVYPGGGKALFNRLWHLTCNAVATQSGMRVRTDVMPMREMKEFLDHLCVLVDSPPQPVPAPVQEPVGWNQVQVCTWIGNQLMTQPPMFERNAVCKFVRSLGRNEKLAKYFPAPQAQPRKADGCNWPVCQTEQYQQALADQVAQDLIGAQPRKAVKLTDDELYEMYSEPAHQPAPVQEPDYKQAFDVWQDKTEWVQETAKPHELGMHRADVLRQRIEAAQPQKPALTADQIEQHIGYRLPPSSMRLLLELIGGHSA